MSTTKGLVRRQVATKLSFFIKWTFAKSKVNCTVCTVGIPRLPGCNKKIGVFWLLVLSLIFLLQDERTDEGVR